MQKFCGTYQLRHVLLLNRLLWRWFRLDWMGVVELTWIPQYLLLIFSHKVWCFALCYVRQWTNSRVENNIESWFDAPIIIRHIQWWGVQMFYHNSISSGSKMCNKLGLIRQRDKDLLKKWCIDKASLLSLQHETFHFNDVKSQIWIWRCINSADNTNLVLEMRPRSNVLLNNKYKYFIN